MKKKIEKQFSALDGNQKCTDCSSVLTKDNCVKNRPMCKDCYNKKCKEYKQSNKEKVSASHKKYYNDHKEKIAEYYKDHYKTNKDTYMENNKKWRSENKEKIREKENELFRNNPSKRLIRNYRSRIWDALKRFKGKENRTLKYLDCDIPFFKKWLEYNFTDKMTFDNYGTYWHVDHVIPCTKFDLSKPEEINHCFRWTNLQPLKAKTNISKQNRIDNVEVISHYLKVNIFAEENNIDIPEFNYEPYLIKEDYDYDLEDSENEENEIEV